MKKLLLMTICMLLATGVMAYDFVSNGMAYTITSKTSPFTVEVAQGVSYSGNIIIPSSVIHNDTIFSVTGIGSYAFERTQIQTVVIPKTVKTIGKAAFQISSIQSVVIPDSVTVISSYLFNECSWLSSITIPKSVRTIEEEVFVDCISLYSVTIPSTVKSIGYGVFSGCYGLSSITIPNSVTSLGYFAFYGCNGLKSVTISDSISSLENSVFESCIHLTSVTIPKSVKHIGYGAFAYCSALSTVTLPDSVLTIDDMAFVLCTGLTSFYANPVTPVDLSNSSYSFHGSSTSTCVLHVPKGSKTAYQNADVWKNFSTIIEDILDNDPIVTSKELNIRVSGNSLFIGSLTVGEPVRILSIDGQIIFEKQSSQPSLEIHLPTSGIYIISEGGKNTKIFVSGE
jgi:hypothetical protein